MIKTDKLSRPLLQGERKHNQWTGRCGGLLTVWLFQDSHFPEPRIYGLTGSGVQIWDVGLSSIITIIGSFDPTL